MELEGITLPDAESLRQEALRGLIAANLHEWLAQGAAGASTEAREALQRARSFGATPLEEEEARRAWRGR